MQTEDHDYGGESGSPRDPLKTANGRTGASRTSAPGRCSRTWSMLTYLSVLLLLVLVVGCGGQSSTTDEAESQQTTPESGPNKREVTLEEGSLRDLIQTQVGDFELQRIDDVPTGFEREADAVEALEAVYEGPGDTSLVYVLVTTRSPEAADNHRQQRKDASLRGDGKLSVEVVDERPVEASGKRVGTLTVALVGGEDKAVLWNNGNLVASVEIQGKESYDAYEGFYKSVPY